MTFAKNIAVLTASKNRRAGGPCEIGGGCNSGPLSWTGRVKPSIHLEDGTAEL